MKLKGECEFPPTSPQGHQCHGEIITASITNHKDDHKGVDGTPCERTNKDNIDEDMINTREVLNKLHELFIQDDIKFINVFNENADHKDVENSLTPNQTSSTTFSDDSIIMPHAS